MSTACILASTTNATKRPQCLLVGVGHRARKRHLPALRQLAEIDLVGAVDVNPEVAIDLPRGVPFFRDVDAALEVTSPTFAIVATPHHVHFPIVDRLLGADVAILKEKPFALNLTQAYALADALKFRNGFLRLALQRQFNPAFRAVKSALAKIGSLRHFEAEYRLNTDPYGDTWRGDYDQAGGGAVLDMGYHTLDLIVFYFGVPKVVHATEVLGRSATADNSVEESVAAILEYESGLIGRVFLSRCEPSKQERFSVIGTAGSLLVTPTTLYRFDKRGTEQEIFRVPDSSVPEGTHMIGEFLASIGDSRLVKQEISRGLNVMRIADAMYASLRDRSIIEVGIPRLESSSKTTTGAGTA